MASSDNRPGFRLPWQSGHAAETEAESAAGTAVADSPAWPSHDLARRQSRGSGSARAAEPGATTDQAATDPDPAAVATPQEGAVAEPAVETPAEQRTPMTDTMTRPALESSLEAPARKPTKFMLDLTRAMRQAADEARESALAQFRGDVERHTTDARAACEAAAAEARLRADDDIAALAEWETAEIERIRRETEEGTTARHARLEAEIAGQAARLDEEMARIRARVDTFEAEMDAFFAHLLQEEDPGRFAGIAEQLPEPPAFDAWTPATMTWTPDPVMADAGTGSGGDAPTATADGTTSDMAAAATAEGSDGATGAGDPGSAAEMDMPADPTGDPDAGMPPMLPNDFAAAEAEAAGWVAADEPASDAAAPADASVPADAALEAEADPSAPWPPVSAPAAAATTSVRTQVAVVGLVSVASIATFKRLLARAPGVHGVQVTSGPDGEFLFTATHDSTLDVAAAVGGIQGFEVEVMESGPGIVMARAVDPEVV